MVAGVYPSWTTALCAYARASLTATLLALTFMASPLAAQGSGSVTGLITDFGTQQPLAGAQVVLAGTNRGALTNVAGRYVIPNVLAGTYQVRAVVLGFSQQTQTVTVSGGQAGG